mgnify:CR=1 FL=1
MSQGRELDTSQGRELAHCLTESFKFRPASMSYAAYTPPWCVCLLGKEWQGMQWKSLPVVLVAVSTSEEFNCIQIWPHVYLHHTLWKP